MPPPIQMVSFNPITSQQYLSEVQMFGTEACLYIPPLECPAINQALHALFKIKIKNKKKKRERETSCSLYIYGHACPWLTAVSRWKLSLWRQIGNRDRTVVLLEGMTEF